jgi:hypothetical protein
MFKGRPFDGSVILLWVRWYLAFGLSLRNLEEMMADRGISVDHATGMPQILARMRTSAFMARLPFDPSSQADR